MDRLPIIQGQKIVETTVRFSSKKLIESMDRLAIIQGQNYVETTVRFSSKKLIESMDRLAIIQGQNYVETTVRFSSNRTIESMDRLASFHKTETQLSTLGNFPQKEILNNFKQSYLGGSSMILLPVNFFHKRRLYLERRQSDANSQKLCNQTTQFQFPNQFFLPRIS